MMSIKNAKQAVALGERRDELIKRAGKIFTATSIHFGADVEPRPGRSVLGHLGRQEVVHLDVEKFADEFQSLVTKELRAQIAAIDDELRALGVEPDAARDPALVPFRNAVTAENGIGQEPQEEKKKASGVRP
jgi:hypothetical protein